VSRRRAQHRLRTQHPQIRVPQVHPLWLLVPAAIVVSAGVLTAAINFTGPPTAPQIAAVQASTLPRPDPTTTEQSRAFLAALSAHQVAVEPHQAVNYGGQVCYMREHFNASPFTLQTQLRQQAPGLRAIDVATLVDDAAQHLCGEAK
jgi:hypothetical protein